MPCYDGHFSDHDMPRTVTALAAAALVVLAGCGQRGALYFRDSPPPGLKPEKTDTYKPVPYPAEPERTRDRDGSDKK